MSNSKKKSNSSSSTPSRRRPALNPPTKMSRVRKPILDKIPPSMRVNALAPSSWSSAKVGALLDPVLCLLGDLLFDPGEPPEGTTLLQEYTSHGGFLRGPESTTLTLTLLQPAEPGRVIEHALFSVQGRNDAECARLALLVIQDFLPCKSHKNVSASALFQAGLIRGEIRKALAALGYSPLMRTRLSILGFQKAEKATGKSKKAP
jgi:hypothetical protein